MSPRIKVIRKILNIPVIKGFKPYGHESNRLNLEGINLLYEEYEALRLSDYNILNHQQASILMGVSRPTFTRIYASALQKIAKAFVEGRQISIEGGKVYFDSDWYHCNNCGCYFNNPEKDVPINSCPLCGNDRVNRFDYENTYIDVNDKSCYDMCMCPNCGFEQVHQFGEQCNNQKCPKCQSSMKRSGSPNCRNNKN